MTMQGADNFAGGETTRQRVALNHQAVMKRISGFDPASGTLLPENVCKEISTTELTATLAEQTPFAFREYGETTLIVRDKDEKLRVMSGAGVWGAAQDVCPILPESVPFRIGPQVVFPSSAPNAKLYAFEPESPSTNLRPLSLKSFADYQAAWKPIVTASDFTGVQLFDCGVAGAGTLWTSLDGGVVVNDAADIATFTIDSTVTAGSDLATKELDPAVSLADKRFLVLDISIKDDTQLYETYGLFPNDGLLLPSGYLLQLLDTGAGVIGAYRIPRCAVEGKIHRVVLNLGDKTDTVTDIVLSTDPFWTPPDTGKTYTVTLYSQAFDEWQTPGNWLMGDVIYEESEWYEPLSQLGEAEAGGSYQGWTGNLVVDGGFESKTTHWEKGLGTESFKGPGEASEGSWCCCVDYTGESIATKAIIPVTEGRWYKFACMYSKPYSETIWQVSLIFYDDAVEKTTVVLGPYEQGAWTKGYYREQTATFQVPTGSGIDGMKIKIESVAGRADALWVDDVRVTAINQAAEGSSIVLHSWDSGSRPALPKLEYYAALAAKNLLGVPNYAYMVSNGCGPSDTQVADPWRTYVIETPLPTGCISAISITAGGTGYTANDVLVVESDGGSGGTVMVTTVNAGVVTGIALVTPGAGYATGTPHTTEGGTGTGCTLNITAVTDQLPVDEYGDYLTHICIYRRRGLPTGYDDDMVWGTAQHIKSIAIGALLEYEDQGDDDDAYIGDVPVPETMEIYADYLQSARHGAWHKGRAWMGGLDWNEALARWERPLSVAVSTDGKPWAFPTGVGGDETAADGVEIDMSLQAVSGSEIQGIMPKGDDIFIFLDTETFLVVGDNPITGYWFRKVANVGLISARTLQDAGDSLVWCDGEQFYRFGGGLQPISRYLIDCSLIDWTKPHGSAVMNRKYRFYCTYDGDFAILTYDLDAGCWSTRVTTAYNFVGITSEPVAQTVYAVTPGGAAVDVYGSTGEEYGLGVEEYPIREVWTQYWELAPEDVHITQAILEIISDAVTEGEGEEEVEVGITLDLEFETMGLRDESDSAQLLVMSGQTRYHVNLDLYGSAAMMKAIYEGEYPPTIVSLRFEIDNQYPPMSWGRQTTDYEWQRDMTFAEPGNDVRFRYLVVDAITDQVNGVDLDLGIDITGADNCTHAETITVVPESTRYYVDLSDKCGYFAHITATYNGESPPDVRGLFAIVEGDAPTTFTTEPTGRSWIRRVWLGDGRSDVQVKGIITELESAADTTLTLTLDSIGTVDDSKPHYVNVLAGRGRYYTKTNVKATFIEVRLDYAGTTPPDVYRMTVDVDEPPRRTT